MRLYYLKDNAVKYSDTDIVFDMTCDVLCVGAGTAGVYASIAASREGSNVILIENSANIGGMHVCGYVSGYYYGADGGSFEEDDRKCGNDNIYFVADSRFPEKKQIHITESLMKYGVKFFCEYTPIGIYFANETAVGIQVFSENQIINIGAKIIIDATSDGHIIRMCPVKKQYGREIDGKTVPFTVRTQYISNGKYFATNTDSGYMNQYDSKDFSKKTILAHANTERYLAAGEFISLAAYTGIREGLSFEGEERLKYSDIIFDNKPDKVLFYAYSDLDKHGHDTAMDEELYQNWWVISNLPTVTVRIPVPLGSVVPKGLKGIVSVGRCLSCDSYSQSAVRMNRDMFRMGECVGVAAAMSVKSGDSFLEIDYNSYVSRVRDLNCFDGDKDKKFGFDYPNRKNSYRAIEFDFDKCEALIETETPGIAFWSCFVAENQEYIADKIYKKMNLSKSELIKFNCAIALGIMSDKRSVEILREMVIKRDCFYFKDCRRSNQFRSVIALCLLGRLGEIDDIKLIEEIIFNDSEFEKSMYHTLEPDYLYYASSDRNFVYFSMFTHACMALVKICKRYGLNTKNLNARFKSLFAYDKIIKRVTSAKSDEPSYIEIADFQKYILQIT